MSPKTRSGLVREPAYFQKDMDKAAEIALFYGFQPIKTPRIEEIDMEISNSLVSAKNDIQKTFFPRPEEKTAILRSLLTWNIKTEPLPAMVQYKRPISKLAPKRQSDEHHYSLDIVGSSESIAEAIAIKAAVAILADHGNDKLIVDINSVGDRNSLIQFEKELANFSKKYSGNLPPEIRQQLKKDPFEALRCEHEKWLEVKSRAPQSLSFLSEQGIEHFREVLEYLETLDIPYRINNSLIGHRNYCSHTIFEIKSAEATSESGPETFAVGTRHNYLAKRAGYKHDVPMMSTILSFKKPTASPKLFLKKGQRPIFFFIQFGSIARLKSLSVIESLRQARIPIHHELNSNKFIGQMASAERLMTPYVIIMGQKEALEGTVVVRHIPTRSQETIAVPQLSTYLGKLTRNV